MKKILLTLCLLVIVNVGFGQTNTFPPSGNIGIGTTTPTYKLDLIGSSRITGGFLNSDNYFEKVLPDIAFANGVANLAVDLKLGNVPLWGYLEVEITSTYNYQNSVGKLTKIYAVGINLGGAIYTNESRVSDVVGTIGDNIAFGELSWDNANSTYKIPISHIVSTGNVYTLKVKMFTNASVAKGVFDVINTGPVYDLTALPKNFVSFNGNVGIGTKSPISPLQIVSDTNPVLTIGKTDNTGGEIQFGNANHGLKRGYLGANDVGFYTTGGDVHLSSANSTPQFTLKLGGNVGIGTTNPVSKLQITDANNPILTIGKIDNTGGEIQFGNANHGLKRGYKEGNDVGLYTTAGDLYLSTTNSTPQFSLKNNGNVGIGTSNPYDLLHIDGSKDTPISLRLNNTNPNVNGGTKLAFHYGGAEVASLRSHFNGGDFEMNLRSNDIMTFITGNTPSTVAERMRISIGGNVGIGTTNPTAKLEVNGNTRINGDLNIFNTTSKLVGFDDPVNYYVGYYPVTGSAGLDLHWYGGIRLSDKTGNVMQITNGNIGIGTTDTKGYKLAVAGEMIAERVVVKLTGTWPDYVFKKNYGLRPLEQLEKFINQNSHLPEVPSAQEVADRGIDVGAMNAKLLQKVEELTLYLIEQNKEIKIQSLELTILRKEVEQLKSKK